MGPEFVGEVVEQKAIKITQPWMDSSVVTKVTGIGTIYNGCAVGSRGR